MYEKLEKNNQNNEQEMDYSKRWLENIGDYASFNGVELDLNRILETMKEPTLDTTGRINGLALIAISKQLTIKRELLDSLQAKAKSEHVETRMAALEILSYIIPLLTHDLAKAPLIHALTIALDLNEWTIEPTVFALFQAVIPKIKIELISFLFDEINKFSDELFEEKKIALLLLMAPRLNDQQASTLIEQTINQEDICTNDQALILTAAVAPYFSLEQMSKVLKIAMDILNAGNEYYIRAQKILSVLLPKLTPLQITDVLDALVAKFNEETKDTASTSLKTLAVLIPYLTQDQLNEVMQDLIDRINEGKLEGYDVLGALKKRLSFLSSAQIRSISEAIVPKLQDFEPSKRSQVLKILMPLVEHLSAEQEMMICLYFMDMDESTFKLRTLIAQPLDQSQIGQNLELIFMALANAQQLMHTDVIEFIAAIFPQLNVFQVDNLLEKIALQLGSEDITTIRNTMRILTAITPQLTPAQINPFLNQMENILKSELWYVRCDALEFLLISAEQVPGEVTKLFGEQILLCMDDDGFSIRQVALKIMKVIILSLDAEQQTIVSKKILSKINDEDSSVRRLATDLMGYFIVSESIDISSQFSNNILVQIIADLYSQLKVFQALSKKPANLFGIGFFDSYSQESYVNEKYPVSNKGNANI